MIDEVTPPPPHPHPHYLSMVETMLELRDAYLIHEMYVNVSPRICPVMEIKHYKSTLIALYIIVCF